MDRSAFSGPAIGLITALTLAATAATAASPFGGLFSAASKAPAAPAAPSLIPQPVSITPAQGAFVLASGAHILVPPNDPQARWIAQYLSDMLKRTRGIELKIGEENGEVTGPAIHLTRGPDAPVGDEAYRLAAAPAGVTVLAANDAGLFYGAVTLLQLATESDGHAGSIPLPALTIDDAPRYPWRGLLLDSVRHFQSPEFVKKLIDDMAVHKLNVLHWHLTDDQGWRLEIKKYPRLTEVGAWRVPAGEAALQDIDPATKKPRLYGGFYTQDQVKDIVAYAAQRHVTIVPEIDMPGHATAAIVAYPWLASTPHPPTAVPSDWGVYPNLYNPDTPTIGFLQDVLTEVIALFPSTYIHVGGDEAVKTQWSAAPTIQAQVQALGLKNDDELQSWMTGRLDAWLDAHGRRLVGWDDILKGGLTPHATVMSWQGPAGAAAAAAQDHDAILAVDPTLYLDHRQNPAPDQPPGRGSLLTLKDIDAFDPAPASLTDEQRGHILGVEGAVWTEHIRTEPRVEFMTFPRTAAIAEIGWSPPGSTETLLARMPAEMARLRDLGVNAADSAFEPLLTSDFDPKTGTVAVTLATESGQGEIRYTTDGAEPTPRSQRYDAPFAVRLPSRVRAATFAGAEPLSHAIERRFDADTVRSRDSHELKTCSGKLDLSLEDDAPVNGPRAVFLVDIQNPCWIYPGAELDGVGAIDAAVGQVPYNFVGAGLGPEVVKFRSPATPEGELEVRLDTCEGPRIAVLPLKPAAANLAVTALPPVAIAPVAGKHDLCFTFTQHALDPLWVIKTINLLPAKAQSRGLGGLFGAGPK
ncbi:MAG TPA: family 20 glycosylhydrolase [Caulobacteraceae bacterium]|nr:family 20 glycosylhydrolase [Caulobacteraceae bacterium]